MSAGGRSRAWSTTRRSSPRSAGAAGRRRRGAASCGRSAPTPSPVGCASSPGGLAASSTPRAAFR
eukprot:4188672-Pyramimonas_sp.AAC.1